MMTTETPDFCLKAVKSGNKREFTPAEARNAYLRAWRKANPDKVKAARERYYKRLAERMTAEVDAHGKE